MNSLVSVSFVEFELISIYIDSQCTVAMVRGRKMPPFIWLQSTPDLNMAFALHIYRWMAVMYRLLSVIHAIVHIDQCPIII